MLRPVLPFPKVEAYPLCCVSHAAWNSGNMSNQSFFGVAFGAPPNTAAGSNPGSPVFWQIVSTRCFE